MARSLRHRGPDDEGFLYHEAAGVALAHRRLSIIDLSSGSHQPMLDEDSGVALAYNGEIYNFRSLREQLIKAGHSFHSSGDTEVVLRSYLEWGMECLSRFAGMFALAIWDPRTLQLHLARDAMGMKPLYLVELGDGICFASEIKAFLRLPGFEARLSPASIQQYLEFGYVFHLHSTILEGVGKLAPGEHVILQQGRIQRRRTWFTPASPDRSDTRGLQEKGEELQHRLQQVVAEHLVADVPVALLLSGGLDSSLLAALAARSGPLTTISMGFDRSSVDERQQAQLVADHIGSDHHSVLIGPEEIRAEIENGAWVFDDLFADWGTISTRLLYRRCRAMGIKVVLVGEGADELFGGYGVFQVPERLGLLEQFRLYRRYAGRRYGNLFGEFHEVIASYLTSGGGDSFHAVQLFESRRQLPNNYVMKVDKASMAESVEARAPYLDRRIAELAYSYQRRDLQDQEENKKILRTASRRDGLLPSSISSRSKFGAPLATSWMDEDASFRDFARSQILRPGSQSEKLGLRRVMESYFLRHRSGQRWPGPISIFSQLAWRLLLLELWSPSYLQTPPALP